MFAAHSRREVALFVATAGSGVVLTVLMLWVVLKYGQPQHLIALFFAPFLVLAFASAYALLKRHSFGSWGCLAFFALQVVSIERDGVQVWPGYSFGVTIDMYQSQGLEVGFGVSSLIFALLAIGVIRQYAEERVISQMPEVTPLLPPNKSLERTREG